MQPLWLGPFHAELPVPGSLDPAALVLSALAAACLFGLRLGVVPCLGITALAGLGLRLSGLG
jgi:chromate transporter